MTPSSRVLVTGATGFLGRHLLRALHVERIPRAVLVRDAAAWHALPWRGEAGDVAVVEGSPLGAAALRQTAAHASVGCIIHAAGVVRHSRTQPNEMIEVNVEGTLRMVRAAKELRARLIFVSSSGTVGCFRNPHEAADEDAPFAEAVVGRWPYYKSKIHAERQARELARELGVELVIVRPPVLLGPDDHRHRSTSYVQKVISRKVPAVPPGGMHFTDVRDVASALARLVHVPSPRPVYHLPGAASTLRQFFYSVSAIAGTERISPGMPRWATAALARLGSLAEHRPSWLPDPVVLEMSTCFWGLSSRFHHELGYAPRRPEETLRDTIAWLRQTAPIPAASAFTAPSPGVVG